VKGVMEVMAYETVEGGEEMTARAKRELAGSTSSSFPLMTTDSVVRLMEVLLMVPPDQSLESEVL